MSVLDEDWEEGDVVVVEERLALHVPRPRGAGWERPTYQHIASLREAQAARARLAALAPRMARKLRDLEVWRPCVECGANSAHSSRCTLGALCGELRALG